MKTPPYTITNIITNALTRIERARGFLEAAQLSEDWIAGMQSRALILEAHHTTHIEGTHLTLAQAEKLLAGKSVPGADPDDKKELLNYRQAFDLVAGYLGSGEPITEGLVREIHKRLVQGVRGNTAAPGEYRKIQNFVINSKTKEVVYTPPAALEVPIFMTELVEWLNSELEVNTVIMAGIAQFQLVHIYPFIDGNGRTARLLSTLHLFRTGYDFKKLCTISEYYDRDRAAYYTAIQSVRKNNMDMTGWIEYFVEGLAIQLKEVQEKGERVIKQDVLARKYELKNCQQRAVAFILDRGAMTIQEYQKLCPKSARRSLQRELKEMVDNGVLVQEGATNRLSYRLKV